MQDPSLNVRLYGTEEEVTLPRVLRAGPLTTELDAGNLRHIRYGGIEVIRAASYIVRDRNWGTYNPVVSDLSVEEHQAGFRVTYTARAGDDAQTFRYRARIEGSEGRLVFSAEGAAEGGAFVTNRTGFVVLHPIVGVAGHPVTIEHVDGTVEEGCFPDLVEPLQPMMELRALTHEPRPGLRVLCRMEGDTFEMEDQRNWTDASYKTYVRPLALPWPYELAPGETLTQSVTVEITGRAADAGAAAGPVGISLGGSAGTMPAIGVGLRPEEVAPTRERMEVLSALGVDHVICHYDPRSAAPADLAALADTASEMGAEPWLEAVIADVEGFAEEVAALGRAVADAGIAFPTVLVSPAADLRGTLPGSEWPPAPPLDALYRAAREAFPNARLGGGMFSFFTELNRKRPPVDLLDLVGFTTAALVHAGDDQTVMENLEALPFIARTAREIAGRLPVSVGPSAIGMRLNPYGAAPMQNPRNIRQAMNCPDPRQRGMLGAAWAIGYAARMAADVTALTFGATTGPHGFVAAPQDWPQPWYEEAGGLFPAYHAVCALAQLAGGALRACNPSDPARVAAIAVEGQDGLVLLIANLSAEPVAVELPVEVTAGRVLDASAFVEAARAPDWLVRPDPMQGSTLPLGPFAVARLLARLTG